MEVYRLTKRFASDELYSLVSQLRRSASSISPTSPKDAGDIAKRISLILFRSPEDLMEVDTFLRRAVRLDYLTPDQAKSALALVAELANMLSILRLKLQYNRPEA